MKIVAIKLLIAAKKAVVGLLLLIATYLVTAVILAFIPVNSNDSDPDKDVTIFLKSNGVHTDIVVPVKNTIKNWSNDIKYIQTTANDSTMQFVAFGWGNKDFYLNTPEWSDLKFSTAFKAAFHIGETAMHTQFYKHLTESEQCYKIELSAKEYQNLVQYISDSFARDSKGNVIWLGNHHYNQNDAFYEANGKYDLFNTCNSWTNAALKAASQKAAVWALTDSAILHHYKK